MGAPQDTPNMENANPLSRYARSRNLETGFRRELSKDLPIQVGYGQDQG